MRKICFLCSRLDVRNVAKARASCRELLVLVTALMIWYAPRRLMEGRALGCLVAYIRFDKTTVTMIHKFTMVQLLKPISRVFVLLWLQS